jgi:nucleotide-binding universal stress UspA family protein
MTRSDSPRSILTAVDFSEQSRYALRWAAAVAARFGSRLTVVTVVDPLLAEAASVRLGQDLAKQETEPALREFVAASWTRTTPAPTQIVFRTATGDAASAILETAETERADLIVMGTLGLGGFRKWLLGSTTERLLRRAKVSVLAVPSADESVTREADSLSHVLAATDFSESSVAAAQVAVHWARAFSAKLTLLHVVEPVTVPAQWRSLVEKSEETRVGSARAKLHALAEEMCASQECDEAVALGRPADLIGSTAVDRRARLIVMGLASEQGAFSPRPGSIAYRVLSSTTVPVLVVPTT